MNGYYEMGEVLHQLLHHARQLNLAGLAAAVNAVAGIAKCKDFQGDGYNGRFYFCVGVPGTTEKYISLEVVDIPASEPEASLGNKVRRFRKLAGMTQDELAKKAGISRPFLSNVENGAAVPTVAKAVDIASALGKTVDEIFSKESRQHE